MVLLNKRSVLRWVLNRAMGLTFSEPLEKVFGGIVVVFCAAAAVTYRAQRRRPPAKAKRRAGAARPSSAKRKKGASAKPPPDDARASAGAPAAPPAPTADQATSPTPPARREAAEESKATGEQPDGRTLVDGVDLADIVDVDLEPPQHTDWEPVAAPRRRKGKGSGASPPRDA